MNIELDGYIETCFETSTSDQHPQLRTDSNRDRTPSVSKIISKFKHRPVISHHASSSLFPRSFREKNSHHNSFRCNIFEHSSRIELQHTGSSNFDCDLKANFPISFPEEHRVR